uniref:Uncharacterized protein n=1 Tax=viral metagenome TaxID=1070528 RepID=A0A6H1ZS57_9ZZZZ
METKRGTIELSGGDEIHCWWERGVWMGRLYTDAHYKAAGYYADSLGEPFEVPSSLYQKIVDVWEGETASDVLAACRQAALR